VILVVCPVCEIRVALDSIPSRLPVVVPHHATAVTDPCDGSGRSSREAWMVASARR